MKYIICSLIVIITLLIIYKINMSLEKSKKFKKGSLIKFNILADCIVIVTKENCIYCEQLEEQIEKSDKKYTIIKLTDEMTFKFDNTFTNLTLDERNNIIEETQKIFAPEKNTLFPTIISKNGVYHGLPQKEILSNIFNI